MKSAEYVGTVVSAYRRVIDSMESGEDERRRALEDARSILQNDFARPKTEFFFSAKSRNPAAETSTAASAANPANPAAPAATTTGTIFRPEQDGGTGISMGTILNVSGGGSERRALVKSDGQITLSPGDSVRLHKADDSRRQAHKLTFARKSGGGAFLISIPEGFEVGDYIYLIQTKSMTRRYPQVLPKDLSPFKRQPGREKAPPLPEGEKPPSMPDRKNPSAKKQHLPEGIFTAVASVEDLYIVQSIKPAGVILPVNRKTIRPLLDEKPLPFKAQEIILTFDPWFPQEEERFLAELPEQLAERGYCRYILNNPGHFSLFRNNSNDKYRNLLIAGPWLYTFNSWAAAFADTLGARYCITPLENNRQNLEKTFPPRKRGAVFVTLFAWPPLFRTKTGSGGLYGFTSFTGSRDESFTLINGDGNSVVIPDQPFSITDKRPFLAEAGFRRFILDFSAGMFNGSFPLKKKLYKEVMNAAMESLPLSGISRFNWKNGFFSEKS
jgi:putative protease